jgi:hypothetical protein
MNEQPTASRLHHHGLGAPVLRTFQRIGECLAYESIGICQHRCDRHYAEVIEIEV